MHEHGAVQMANLQELRKHADLSRAQLAARTGGAVDTSTIYRIEHGERVPNLSTRTLLANALGVAVDAIEWPRKGEAGASSDNTGND